MAALDLVEAWMHDEDADISNIADDLAREPQAACYALARITDVALQLWANAADIDRDQAFAALRAKVEGDLADSPHGGW
ncbi:hypothetical protein [Planosporangium mesophilum]|uniref:hypothetical protein n=1 Tax=Planosporangium mesophilum TaxID=689768 RepID=UPI00143874F9|nr:hypothetical protein [Planosporangium mesophilum]NJC85785.1 hypothetical protein [Planosporangium mesophilum]